MVKVDHGIELLATAAGHDMMQQFESQLERLERLKDRIVEVNKRRVVRRHLNGYNIFIKQCALARTDGIKFDCIFEFLAFALDKKVFEKKRVHKKTLQTTLKSFIEETSEAYKKLTCNQKKIYKEIAAYISALKDIKELASTDNEIGQLEESLKRESELLKQYMTSPHLVERVDVVIGQLKESLKRESELLKQYMASRKRESELLKQYMISQPLVERVDLTTDDKPASKRQLTENVTKKGIAGILLEQTGQKLVKVNEEQVETRAELNDVREDLEDKQEDVDNYTNFLQSKIDELAALAEAAGADKAKIAEIKQRTYRKLRESTRV